MEDLDKAPEGETFHSFEVKRFDLEIDRPAPMATSAPTSAPTSGHGARGSGAESPRLNARV